jgi:hypothetical protein
MAYAVSGHVVAIAYIKLPIINEYVVGSQVYSLGFLS